MAQSAFVEAGSAMTGNLLTIEGLSIGLPAASDRPRAVSNIDLTLMAGEVLCLVGESGFGQVHDRQRGHGAIAGTGCPFSAAR